MIFWKRVQQAINKLWYPRSVTIGKPVETQELANRIARESTVSPAAGGKTNVYRMQGYAEWTAGSEYSYTVTIR